MQQARLARSPFAADSGPPRLNSPPAPTCRCNLVQERREANAAALQGRFHSAALCSGVVRWQAEDPFVARPSPQLRVDPPRLPARLLRPDCRGEIRRPSLRVRGGDPARQHARRREHGAVPEERLHDVVVPHPVQVRWLPPYETNDPKHRPRRYRSHRALRWSGTRARHGARSASRRAGERPGADPPRALGSPPRSPRDAAPVLRARRRARAVLP